MKRKKFKRNILCSSENYEESRQSRPKFIRENHIKNIEFIEEIMESLPKRAYIRVFGKLVPIEEKEIIKYKQTYTIIYL